MESQLFDIEANSQLPHSAERNPIVVKQRSEVVEQFDSTEETEQREETEDAYL